MRAERVKMHARAIGFDLVGVAPPSVPDGFARYDAAMDAGYGADMGWLSEKRALRQDVRNVHPSAQAVVALGVNHYAPTPGYLEAPPSAEEGWIARYAQGKDYHVVIRKMLVRLVKAFEADPALGGSSFDHRISASSCWGA